jgi:hypothetical protein
LTPSNRDPRADFFSLSREVHDRRLCRVEAGNLRCFLILSGPQLGRKSVLLQQLLLPGVVAPFCGGFCLLQFCSHHLNRLINSVELPHCFGLFGIDVVLRGD